MNVYIYILQQAICLPPQSQQFKKNLVSTTRKRQRIGYAMVRQSLKTWTYTLRRVDLGHSKYSQPSWASRRWGCGGRASTSWMRAQHATSPASCGARESRGQPTDSAPLSWGRECAPFLDHVSYPSMFFAILSNKSKDIAWTLLGTAGRLLLLCRKHQHCSTSTQCCVKITSSLCEYVK